MAFRSRVGSHLGLVLRISILAGVERDLLMVKTELLLMDVRLALWVVRVIV